MLLAAIGIADEALAPAPVIFGRVAGVIMAFQTRSNPV